MMDAQKVPSAMIPCTRCTSSHGDNGFVLCRRCRSYMRRLATDKSFLRLCKTLGLTQQVAIASGLWSERML